MTGAARSPAIAGPGRLLGGRLRRAVPSPRAASAGAFLWSVLMAGGAYWGVAHWANPSHILTVLLIYAAGAAAAFPLAMFMTEAVAGEKMPTQRFASAFLLLALTTVGVTALLFAVIYRAYYAHWHEEAFSPVWVLQFAGTVLSAFYQFAVLGLRLYFPYGLIGLFAVSLWFAVRAR
ncbi:hypothetical protein [Chelativorans sp. AA-79]|uniref:hypothetical protein n=1 Tax=Chelativorans sp. AA-79 TaxID=3028735 RepID=UPI0023F86C39|nr:hypothetical protein [Chelativorans sp. AA-79]WEX11659.1 hypothetical protein PVE73_12395 [Chelativorans sp. AA-79]